MLWWRVDPILIKFLLKDLKWDSISDTNLNQSINIQSIDHLINQSIKTHILLNWSIDQSSTNLNQSIHQLIRHQSNPTNKNHSFNRGVNQFKNSSVNQIIHRFINSWIHQPIDPVICTKVQTIHLSINSFLFKYMKKQ